MSELVLEPLPTPRLEIRWFAVDDEHCFADYRIVIAEPDKLDARSNDWEGDDEYGVIEITGEMSGTHCGSPVAHYTGAYGIRTPFRDGVHIIRDAEKLGLRAFVTHEGMACEVFSREQITEDPTKEPGKRPAFPFKMHRWRTHHSLKK